VLRALSNDACRHTSLRGVVGLRSVHGGAVLQRFYESSPKGEYRDWKKAEEDLAKSQRERWWGFKDGFKELRNEVKKWSGEMTERVVDEPYGILHGDKDPLWTFNSKEVLSKFDTVCDTDHHEGFSKCELVMSPTGKGLFQGFVNTTPPKDGRVKYSGYCVMKSKDLGKSFRRISHMNWEYYSHLVMRVRGDGRTYVVNLSTAGFYDITWNDVYHYVLFTRGGPYWQNVKIPFSKFVCGSKGRLQDYQDPVPLDNISSFGIAAAKIDGPFCLEIDSIGLEYDHNFQEEFAYEMYKIPKYIANV